MRRVRPGLRRRTPPGLRRALTLASLATGIEPDRALCVRSLAFASAAECRLHASPAQVVEDLSPRPDPRAVRLKEYSGLCCSVLFRGQDTDQKNGAVSQSISFFFGPGLRAIYSLVLNPEIPWKMPVIIE